jgi:hypothetical protein
VDVSRGRSGKCEEDSRKPDVAYSVIHSKEKKVKVWQSCDDSILRKYGLVEEEIRWAGVVGRTWWVVTYCDDYQVLQEWQ